MQSNVTLTLTSIADQKGTDSQGSKVAKAGDRLLASSRDKASKQDNPIRGARMNQAVDTLQQLLPQVGDSVYSFAHFLSP
jgi:hypothetical protein